MARALQAGAVVALPRSTPPATLARVIQRLLAPPKHPAKYKAPRRHLGSSSKN
jgi:hypothetical protein